MDIGEELEFLYATLKSQARVYMLEDVLLACGKEYCCDDVHRWGRTEEGRGWYGRIKDLVRGRVMGMVEDEKLDRGMALELMKPFGEIEYGGDVEYVLSESDRRMLERAGVLLDG